MYQHTHTHTHTHTPSCLLHNLTSVLEVWSQVQQQQQHLIVVRNVNPQVLLDPLNDKSAGLGPACD